ncbi:DUF2306 domain-containing protein [Duganella margarita]|nr:DUF2306 domain-containing protein [Duganella margarita]
MALISTIIALVSLRYLPGKGPVPEVTALNRYFNPWIKVHAAGAALALLLGATQFLPAIRARWPGWHRVGGRLYVLGCLVGGVSGLVLAAGTSAGAIAGAGFGALGSAWLMTTGIAVYQIRKNRVTAHRQWMIRSFALTLAAVTLRLYLPLSGLLSLDFLAVYQVVAWLCWVPNILFAEWYLGRRRYAEK